MPSISAWYVYAKTSHATTRPAPVPERLIRAAADPRSRRSLNKQSGALRLAAHSCRWAGLPATQAVAGVGGVLRVDDGREPTEAFVGRDGRPAAFFLREATAMQAGDRGLRDAISVSEGFEALTGQRQRLSAAVNALVGRAKAAGAVRPDFEGTDVPVIFSTTGAVAIAGAVADDTGDGDLWRRYLELILDGIRPQAMPRRPLPVDAPTPDQVTAVMRNYHRGERKASQP